MASRAIVGADIGTVLDVGASVVPPTSRMAAAITTGRELGRSGGDPTEAYAALEAEFDGMHWVHSLNNTALVAYALEAGHLAAETIVAESVPTSRATPAVMPSGRSVTSRSTNTGTPNADWKVSRAASVLAVQPVAPVRSAMRRPAISCRG